MKLTVSLSPHFQSSDNLYVRMWNVVIAMLPSLIVAFWVFGLPVLWVMLLSIGTCLLTEFVISTYLLHKPFTLLNGSAFITGMLLAFNLPSILPWWMVIIGGFVSIAIGKMSFGGLGCNIWNPALVGRVFLLLSFPAAMTTWPTNFQPFIETSTETVATGASKAADASSGATFLTYLNSGKVDDSQFLDIAIVNING